jgi:biotin operon repressor
VRTFFTYLKREYEENGRTVTAIAKELGCSHTAVGRALATLGIARRPPGGSTTFPQLHDPAWVRHEYLERARSCTDIAATLGCSLAAVSAALQRFGIRSREQLRQEELHRLRDRAWLEREYVEKGRDTVMIGAELGCSSTTVITALRRFDIPLRKRGFRPRYPELHDRPWLEREYGEKGRAVTDIARELGCTHKAVRVALNRLQIPRR